MEDVADAAQQSGMRVCFNSQRAQDDVNALLDIAG